MDANRSEVHPVKPMGLFCLTEAEIPLSEYIRPIQGLQNLDLNKT